MFYYSMHDLNEIRNTRGLYITHLNENKWDNIKANFLDPGIHVLAFSATWLHAL